MYLSRALSSTHFSPTHKTESGASVIVIINHHHHLDQTIIGAGAISFAYTNVYLLQPNVASLLPIHPLNFSHFFATNRVGIALLAAYQACSRTFEHPHLGPSFSSPDHQQTVQQAGFLFLG